MPITVLTNGISISSQEETRQQLRDLMSVALPNVDLSDNSPLAWQLSTIADMDYFNSLELQNIIFQSTARYGTGIFLDQKLLSRNTQRVVAQNGTAQCICIGSDATIIPQFTQIKKTDGIIFQNNIQGIITKGNAYFISFEVGVVGVGTVFAFTIGTEIITYTAIGTETGNDIINALIIAIGINPLASSLINSALVNGRLEITSKTPQGFYSYTNTPTLVVFQVGTPILFTSLTGGTFAIPVNTVNQIVNAVIGFVSVNNVTNGTQGALLEGDDEARARYFKFGLYANATATPLGIQNAILKLNGVTFCKVIDNKSNLVVGGRPPHSVTCVVEGGEDQEIAQTLRGAIGNSGVAGGVVTDGNTTINYTDPTFGNSYIVRVERPTIVYIHIELTIPNQTDGDYSFVKTPATISAVRSSLFGYCSANFGIGKDIKRNDVISAVTLSTAGAGISNITVRLAKTLAPLDIPAFQNINVLEVSEFEKSLFDTTRIIIL